MAARHAWNLMFWRGLMGLTGGRVEETYKGEPVNVRYWWWPNRMIQLNPGDRFSYYPSQFGLMVESVESPVVEEVVES